VNKLRRDDGGVTIANASIEVEWQFDAPALDAVERWLRAQPAYAPVGLDDRGEKTQRDTYFDSPDWRVFLAGYSLRMRSKGDASEVTLKALARPEARPEDRGPVRRAEFSEPGQIEALATSDGPVGARVRLMLRGHSIRPLFTVTTRRHTWVVRSPSSTALAEIALDDTTVSTEGGVSSTLQRVEIEELVPGGLASTRTFVEALRAACSLTPATTSKFEAGLLAAGLRPAPPDLGPIEIAPGDLDAGRAYAILRRRFGELLACESGTALGEDPEAVHQMRVATRRLRAALRVFDSVLPPEVVAARDEWRWLARLLGAVRDLDVQLELLEALRLSSPWDEANSLAPLVAQFERERTEARAALLEALGSDRYARLVGSFRGQLIAGSPGDAADTPSREVGRSIISRRYRRFRRDARLLRRRSPHAEYHALRIRGKRLRYSLELFVDLYGREGALALVSLRAIQDRLGELQDLATTDERLRGLVQTHATEMPAETLVMIGRLIERHRTRAAEVVDAFPRTLAPLARRFGRLRRAPAWRHVGPAIEEPAEDDAPSASELNTSVLIPEVMTPSLRPSRGVAWTFIRMFRKDRA